MTERDTHFQGFAELLVSEMRSKVAWVEPFEGSFEDVYTLIAQRAYDLVAHVVGETIGTSDISHVPDLTEWPSHE